MFYGGGIWTPDNRTLESIRDAIASSPEQWKQVIEHPYFKQHFTGVEGESLIRPPVGFDPNHPFIEDIKRKSYFALKEVDSQQALLPHFIDDVDEAFIAAAPNGI